MMNATRPNWLDDEQLEDALLFLDDLRDSGITNMYGARPYLQEWWSDEYNVTLEKKQASEVLTYWMTTFGERQGKVTR